MKSLVGIIMLLLVHISSAQTIQDIRQEFHKAVLDPKESKAFHSFMKEIDEELPIVLAYKAVSEAMLAQVIWNPFSKFSQVLKYDKGIQEAVSRDQENIEIRFLRFAIEYNLPSFLGMNKHLDEDLSTIVSKMNSIETINLDPSYGRYILYFLESTDLCTEDQILAMKETLSHNITF